MLKGDVINKSTRHDRKYLKNIKSEQLFVSQKHGETCLILTGPDGPDSGAAPWLIILLALTYLALGILYFS